MSLDTLRRLFRFRIGPGMGEYPGVEDLPDVLLVDRRIDPADLRRLVARFEDMVKYGAPL